MEKIKLGVVFGGRSSEYPVSLHSTASFLRALNPERYEPVLIGIDRQGNFYLSHASIEEIEADQWIGNSEPALFGPKGIFTKEGKQDLDIVFPVLHGKNGEDGTLQGMLELYEIPYVGSDVTSSANNMDKERMHRLVEQAGIPAADYLCLYESEPVPAFEEIKEKIALPWIIKPCRAGSSFGVSFVEDEKDFEKAVQDAFFYDGRGKILVEKAIDGFEIGCAVLGNDTLQTGEIDEIETANSFFDYEGKYDMKDSAIHCPARISKEQSDLAKELAKKIYKVMDCSGLARVDMFVDKEGNILLNEVNTIPGFTEHSRYPSMMKAAGLSFSDLIDELVDLGLQRKVGAS